MNDEVSHDSEAEDEEEYSSDEEDEVPTKYINASYVDVIFFSNLQSLKNLAVVQHSQLNPHYLVHPCMMCYVSLPLGILVAE